MNDAATSAFALPARLHAKGEPALIAMDERVFTRIRRSLDTAAADTEARLARTRLLPGRSGQEAMDRDLETQRLSARLRLLRRFGLDACIGRMTATDGTHRYVGRFGLAGDTSGSDTSGTSDTDDTDDTDDRLLIDWRAPAAEPFFAASHGNPMGLSSRRRYRWAGGRIVDYWDEVFTPDGLDHSAALDDQSAFIASLGAERSARMRDVLGTIQTDQDAIIRADSHGALVVDGGPGTGKTVVALHRAAYLLYADPRLQTGRGGLLFVGPHRPYLDYIDDVLPSLGEEGALVATLNDLVPGFADAPQETNAGARRAKADARLADAVDAATRLWERPPRRAVRIPTLWGVVTVTAAEWAEVFATAEDGLPHNEVRGQAWDALLELLTERVDATLRDGAADAVDDRWAQGWGDASSDDVYRDAIAADGEFDAYGLDSDEGPTRGILEQDEELRALFDRAWPLLDPEALVRGLWRDAALLRTCAPWLSTEEVATLTAGARAGATPAWTDADLPILDAARLRVGDPRGEVRRRRARAEAAADREVMSDVVTHLIAADDSDLKLMSMLRGQDLRRTLATAADSPADPLAGPFAHIVVDEAQELTDAQWAMLLRRNPARSFTIVGDRAQARRGFAETWADRLRRVGLDHVEIARLTVNYRTPEEVMSVAGPVIRAVLPDANVPVAVRRSGVPVRFGRRAQRAGIVDAWLADHSGGIGVVIGDPSFAPRERVRSLSPQLVKGLEFDLVVLVEPDSFGAGITGDVDRYVAMTRATGELVILAG